MVRILKVLICALFAVFFTTTSYALVESASAKPKLIFFYSVSCHECAKVKAEILPKVYAKFKDKIDLIEFRDIADLENYKLLLGLQKQYGVAESLKVPVVFVAGNFLSGSDEISQKLDALLEGYLSSGSPIKQEQAFFDLNKHFSSFTFLAVTSAGLIDGINPCAFTVIVFFISFLALQGYRKRELFIIGLSFISAVFFTYLLIGLGLVGFFYCISGFWLARKIVNLAIGVFSIVLGFLAVGDCFNYKKTGETEGLILQLPQSIKIRIRSVIAGYYRKPKDTAAVNKNKANAGLILTALACGFLVSILEAVCTGQTYLPTISFILKTSPEKLTALGYLLFYNLMFILPLLIIFLVALLGATSTQLSDFLKKHFLTTKVLMAVLFFGLGIFIIWRS